MNLIINFIKTFKSYWIISILYSNYIHPHIDLFYEVPNNQNFNYFIDLS